MRSLADLYSWNYPLKLIAHWRKYPSLRRYFATCLRSNDTSLPLVPEINLTPKERFVRIFLRSWMTIPLIFAVFLPWSWYYHHLPQRLYLAAAVLISYPLLLIFALPLARGIWKLAHPKMLFRSVMSSALEQQVKILRKRNSFKLVGVAGSVGKTSTKMAIIRVLGVSRRVQWQDGNINDRTDVPLFYSEQSDPSNIFNVVGWIKVFINNARLLRQPYPYEFAVLELGTSRPGYIDEFRYLKPDLIIVTAVTSEHMEFFKTLDAVANEELHTLDFSKQALVNIDDTPARYLEGKKYVSYSMQKSADYRVTQRKSKRAKGQEVTLELRGERPVTLNVSLLGEQGAKTALAAASAAHLLGLSPKEIKQGMAAIEAYAGRMRVFEGHRRSAIIDDTYNAAPAAVKAALDVLHAEDAPQRIAILGSMNELGTHSAKSHQEIGRQCDPSKLDLVVTIGEEAEKHLAPAAKERGCQVKSFPDPYKAGEFVRSQLQEGAIVLGKGSQNGIFVEEAVKLLLANKTDETKLVRQSPHWMRKKAEYFAYLSAENP